MSVCLYYTIYHTITGIPSILLQSNTKLALKTFTQHYRLLVYIGTCVKNVGLNIYLIPFYITTQLVATKFFFICRLWFYVYTYPNKKKHPHRLLHNNAYTLQCIHITHIYMNTHNKSSAACINVSTTHPIIQYHIHINAFRAHCTTQSRAKTK